jgi:hypothetical protein
VNTLAIRANWLKLGFCKTICAKIERARKVLSHPAGPNHLDSYTEEPYMAGSENITNLINDIEKWLPVPGYEGVYSVSDCGRVRSEHACNRSSAICVLKPDLNRGGYPQVHLYRHSRPSTRTVHGIVAEVFISPRPKGLHVNHIDGNKLNPRPSNLEYVTAKENQLHASRLGLMASADRHGSKTHPEKIQRGPGHWSKRHPDRTCKGDRNGSRIHPERLRRGTEQHLAKLTDEQVKEIRGLYSFRLVTFKELAARYGVHFATIRNVVKRKTWFWIP